MTSPDYFDADAKPAVHPLVRVLALVGLLTAVVLLGVCWFVCSGGGS